MVSPTASDDTLISLYNSFAGDQIAKTKFLVNERETTLRCLVQDIDRDVVKIQHLKLDFLYSLLNLDEMIRNGISQDYLKSVKLVFKYINLSETLSTNDYTSNLKYFKLIGLCLNNCPVESYPHLDQIISYLFKTSEEIVDYEINTNSGRIIDNLDIQLNNILKKQMVSELLLTISLSKDFTDIGDILLFHLNDLLLSISNKYLNEINFKYAVKVNITNREKTPNFYFDYYSNMGIDISNKIPNPPRMINNIDKEIIVRSLVLYSSASIHKYMYPTLWKNTTFVLFITSLLKYPDTDLKLSSLSFLLNPIINDKPFYKRSSIILDHCLPYLISSLYYDYLPFWFDTFGTLIILLEIYNQKDPLNNPINLFIERSNLHLNLLDLLTKCLSIKCHDKYTLKTTIQLIKLWASLSAFDEQTRILVINSPNILIQLQNSIQSHNKLVQDFIQYNKAIVKTNSNSDLQFPVLFDSDLVLAWLQLLKSFSRSVTILRTKIPRTKLPETLTDLLSTLYEMTLYCYNSGDDFLEREIDIMSLALGNICNFIVEFSSLQASVLQNGIIGTIKKVLTDPLFNEKINHNNNRGRTSLFSHVSLENIKTYSLWVLRHLMYNCQNQEKLDLLEKIPLNYILDFINDPSWAVQEQCFQLIRNLTCNSRRVVNILLEKFKIIEYTESPETGLPNPVGSTYLFEFMSKKMKRIDVNDRTQRKTLEAILYIVNNIAAVNENKKELVIEQDEILFIIKNILSESAENRSRFGNNSELKLASLWVLNNLLWNSAVSTYTQFVLEGYSSSNGGNDNSDSSRNNMRHSASKSYLVYSGDNEESNENIESDTPEESYPGEIKEDDEFVHSVPENGTDSRVHANELTVGRCRKLVDLGMYDLVKQNICDESLDVREKARTLLYHMDLLLKNNS